MEFQNQGRRSLCCLLWICAVLWAGATSGLAAENPKQSSDETEAAIDRNIEKLISELGNNKYALREQAQKELAKLGSRAFDKLSIAQHHEDIEINLRARYLIKLIRFTWTRPGDSDRIKKILEKYSEVTGKAKLEKIQQVADLANDESVEVLCRFVRYEKSNVLSKQAAISIIQMHSEGANLTEKRSALLSKKLGSSERPGALWLGTLIKSQGVLQASLKDQEDILKDWKKWVEDEQNARARSSLDTNNSIVIALMQHRHDLLKKLARQDQAIEIMVKLFDYMSQLEKLAKVQELALISNDENLEVLCRFVRGEKTDELLSRHAAIGIIKMYSQDSSLSAKQAALILKSLGSKNRPAAAWLRALAKSQSDPAAALADWEKLVVVEQKSLTHSPQPMKRTVVFALMQYQVELLQRLDRQDQALEVMNKLFNYADSKDVRSLVQIVDWLAEKKAWTVVDRMSQRFEARFNKLAILKYALAEARKAQGKIKRAQELALEAFQIDPVDASQPQRLVVLRLNTHLVVAYNLANRGQWEWAEREYRYTIDKGPKQSAWSLRARSLLGEMLHDLGSELDAAKVLEGLVDAMKDPAVLRVVQQLGRKPSALRSRMHYLYAMHYEAGKTNRAKQLEHLEKAIGQDPGDGDVIIALYHLGKDDPARHKKTLALIQQAVEKFREQIKQDPSDSSPYNQLAWVVSNTEGNFDEALRCSIKSLELRPNRAGLLDTLAHCYAAKGNLEKAVEVQTRANKLEPHSGVIARKLIVFKKALAQSKKNKVPNPK